ncbi:hypothetical protein QQ045_010010 [Rhodiola kirilowii]
MNEGICSLRYECIKKLVEMLEKIQVMDMSEMSLDTALLCLDLQSNVLMANALQLQPKLEAAKRFLRSLYNDVTRCSEEVLRLPLAGFEVVLANDGLRAPSEDVVLDLVLKYIRNRYPSMEERQNVFMTRLCHLIRYPYVSHCKLRSLLNCPEINSGSISKVVLDSFSKSDIARRRAYTIIPVEVTEFKLSQPRYDLYLNLKRDVCANLFPAGRVDSKTFDLNGHIFSLYATCNIDQHSASHCFGLFLYMHGSKICRIQSKFSVITKPSEDFEDKMCTTFSLTGGSAMRMQNLVKLPWTEFIAFDSKYFVGDIVYLKVEVIFKQDPELSIS